ncbi:hypothetical protein [Roseicella aquatilis]|uniref:Glycosyltransferase RgtA/B/C/D-like domain-containing protein n=1 Tax=Roseicella aquatilis TaxID=2527868 RepID=A0A4R4DQT5_9PROT|nr:hypothetical protein [Roseicella aquatilis]TCZ64499.1 hypothetical protein EXY23_07610 [Roseicella aquatilis]
MISPVRRWARTILAALGASLLLSFLFALLSWQAAGLAPERARTLLRPLVETGSLFEMRSLPLGTVRIQRWYGNDCLVLAMLVLPQGESRAREAFSPWLAASPLAPLAMADPAGGSTAGPCLRLAELLEPGAERAVDRRYDRYLHGHRVAVALLLPLLGPIGLQVTVLGMLAGLLAGLAGCAGLRAGLRLRRGDPRWRRDAGFAGIGLCLLAFYGLPALGFWVSHALSDLVLAAFLWAMWLLPGREGAGPPWLLGAFGCCVALFEFLTGGLPLGAGLVLLAAALAERPQGMSSGALPGALRSLAAFLAGAALPFALKAALALLVFPEALNAENAEAFTHRFHGPVLPELPPPIVAEWSKLIGFDLRQVDGDPWLRLRFLLFRLEGYYWQMGLGSGQAGRLVIRGSLAGLALLAPFALWRNRARAMVALGAALLLLGWYLVFLNHSMLHPVWMARCMVIFPAALWVLAVPLLPGPRRAAAALPGGLPMRA